VGQYPEGVEGHGCSLADSATTVKELFGSFVDRDDRCSGPMSVALLGGDFGNPFDEDASTTAANADIR
jgi:hypothetical protein